MYLTPNFQRTETACKCGCGKYGADIELILVMQALRDHFGAAIEITSWFRCYEHNCRPVWMQNENGIYGAGSNEHSWHLTGAACDFKVKGVSPKDVAIFLRQTFPDRYGVGIYKTFVHLDMRPVRADWDFQNGVKKNAN